MVTLYGTTGALEAARRALNVVFDADGGRPFLTRKAVDIVSTVVLMTLILISLVLVFVGGRLAEDLLGFLGLGETVVRSGTSHGGRAQSQSRCSCSPSSTT